MDVLQRTGGERVFLFVYVVRREWSNQEGESAETRRRGTEVKSRTKDEKVERMRASKEVD